MLTLTAACAAAFAARQITIDPILEIATDTTLTTWTKIPASALISRPVRVLSPVLSRTPVGRLDFEIVITDDIRALLLPKRMIRYSEGIADQTFKRFYGFLETPQKAWTIQNGVIVETCRVSCYSVSQHLKALNYERINTAAIYGTAATTDQVSLTYIIDTYTEVSYRATTGDDYLSADHLFSPNALGPSNLGQARIYNPVTATYLYAPTNFTVQIVGTDFTVHWTGVGTAPAVGKEYLFSCPQVVGFVVPHTPTYHTATTPSVPATHTIQAASWTTGLGTSYITKPWDVPQIGTADLGFYRKLSADKSKPRFYIRAGSGTTMGTESTVTADWTVDYDNGYAYYSSLSGSSGTRLIFSDNAYTGNDIMHVGVRELYWPDPTNTDNDVIHGIYGVYSAMNLRVDLTLSDYSGVTLGDYRISNVTGEVALRSILANAPPNYTVFDKWTDTNDAWPNTSAGEVMVKSVVQAGTADFTLSQITSLRDKETPAELYTCVRVLSLISTDVSPWYGDIYGSAMFAQVTGNCDLADWTDPYHIWDKRSSTAATIAVSPSAITLSSRPNCNIVERVKSISVKFTGKLSVYRITDYHDDSSGTMPAAASRVYLAPYAVYYAATAQTIALTIDSLSKYGEGGEHPEKIILEFASYGAVTCTVYQVNPTVDRYSLSCAYLADIAPNDGSWSTVSVAGTADSTYEDYRVSVKAVPSSLLKSWMLYYNTPNTVGNEEMYYWRQQYHRIYEVTDSPGLSVVQGLELAEAYLDDFYRRATAREADVVYEPRVEFGDTVAVYDPTDATTSNYTVVGWRDGGSSESPTTTLELADYN